MTVEQLIEELKKHPPQAEAVIVHQDWTIKKVEIDTIKNVVTLK